MFSFGAFGVARAASDDDQPVVGTASISESTALSIAEEKYTGTGKFTDIELEMENGVLVYAVEYTESDGNEVDVKINAKTGAVVLIESDRDEAVDDDANEDDVDEDERIGRLEMLLNLLNQLLALLRAQQA
jgi:hypothetical protein